MYQFVEKYEKYPRLTNLQILEIRKIVLKVTKCADSWRNTKKSKWRLATPLQLTAEYEIRKLGQFFFRFHVHRSIVSRSGSLGGSVSVQISLY